MPERVVAEDGRVLYTRADIERGRQVWQSMGGMQLGSIWGHGGYVAQSAINTAAAAAQGSSLAHLPVHGMMGRHGYAAYSGMMDPNLQSLAYAGRYSPSMAAAQAVAKTGVRPSCRSG